MRALSLKKSVSVVAVALVLSAWSAVLGQNNKVPFAVYVKGGNAAINKALGVPIEKAFTASGSFASEKSKEFLRELEKQGEAIDNAKISELATSSGVRFICIVDASNVKVKLPASLTGSATISILDAETGSILGTPQTVAMPPKDIATVGKALVNLAASAAFDATFDAVAAGAQADKQQSTDNTSRSTSMDGTIIRIVIVGLLYVAVLAGTAVGMSK